VVGERGVNARAALMRVSVVVQSKTPEAVLICDHPVSLSQKRCPPNAMLGHGVFGQSMCMPKNDMGMTWPFAEPLMNSFIFC
jgi:hypothetical protein